MLFNEGRSFKVYPLRTVWLITSLPSASPVQVLITVSSKSSKKAVDRNLLKRRMREAYRKNKGKLYNFYKKKQLQCALAIIYSGSGKSEYIEIEQKILLILNRLEKEYEKYT